MAPNEITCITDKLDAIALDLHALRQDLQGGAAERGYFERVRDLEYFAKEHTDEHRNFRRWLFGVIGAVVVALILQGVSLVARLVALAS